MDMPIGSSGRGAREIAKSAARLAGDYARERFHRKKRISFKSPGNVVTNVDTEAEAMVFALLRQEFPDHALVGEESAADAPLDQGFTWIVDPVDGTRNYSAGIPIYSTVVGLAYNGEVLIGANYDPERDEMFEAERGQGAFLNGRPLRVTAKSELKDCVLGFDMPYDDVGARQELEMLAGSIWPNMATVRVLGSSALGISYAAAGRTDLYFHHGLSPWDQVAGILLVEEAGGVVTDRTGARATLCSDGLIASSAGIHAQFLRATESAEWRRPTR